MDNTNSSQNRVYQDLASCEVAKLDSTSISDNGWIRVYGKWFNSRDLVRAENIQERRENND